MKNTTISELKEELFNTITFTLDYDMDDLNMISQKEDAAITNEKNEIRALSEQVNNFHNEGTHLLEEIFTIEKENQPVNKSLAERINKFCYTVSQHSQNTRWKLIKFLYAEEETDWAWGDLC